MAEAEGAEVSLLRDLRALLVETLAGWGGMDSGPPERANARAVETRRISIRDLDGGTDIGHGPRGVKIEEEVTRQLDVEPVLEEGAPDYGPLWLLVVKFFLSTPVVRGVMVGGEWVVPATPPLDGVCGWALVSISPGGPSPTTASWGFGWGVAGFLGSFSRDEG